MIFSMLLSVAAYCLLLSVVVAAFCWSLDTLLWLLWLLWLRVREFEFKNFAFGVQE